MNYQRSGAFPCLTSNKGFKIVATITCYTLRKVANGMENYVLSEWAPTPIFTSPERTWLSTQSSDCIWGAHNPDDPRHMCKAIPRYTADRKGAAMPTIETIKATDAPPPPRKMSEATSELLAALNRLKKDEVLRLQPDTGKSMRGLKTSVGRIASNNKLKVESWTDGAEDYLYVRKVL